MGMRRELWKRWQKAEGRLRREGRRLASVLLCGALVAGNLSAVPVAVLADSDSDDDYIYEIEREALQETLQTAVSEGNTVNEEMEFYGEFAEEYDQIFEADGALYELDADDLAIEKDNDRDKDMGLRVFVRVKGSIGLDEEYGIDGSEEIIFLLTNKADETVIAEVAVGNLETGTVSILPADSFGVEVNALTSAAGSSAVNSTAVSSAAAGTAAVSGGSGSGGGSGRGFSSGGTASAASETALEDLTGETSADPEAAFLEEPANPSVEGYEIVISDDEDAAGTSEEAEGETDVHIVDDTADQSGSNDSEVSAVDRADDSLAEDPETENTENAEKAEDAKDDINDAEDTNNTEYDTNDTKDKDIDDTENIDDTKDTENSDIDPDDSDQSSDTGEALADDDRDEDTAGENSEDTGTEDSDNITEDSEVSVGLSSISLHKTEILMAEKATVSDVETASVSDASPSDADHQAEGVWYESVWFDHKGAAAFVTTAADLWLDANQNGQKTLESEGEDYRVEVNYDLEARLPKNVELTADEYDKDSETYLARYEEAAALYGWDEDAEKDFRLFNITLVADGEEVEPDSEVNVTISFLEKEDLTEYDVIHYGEDETEIVEVVSNYEDGTQNISFSTDGFTDYGISLASDDGGTNSTVENDKTYITSFSIAETITGTEPFDSNSDAGNDENGTNKIVRSFDTLSYTLSLEMDAYGHTETESVSYDTARASFAFVLPCTSDKAEFDTASMAWMDTTSGYEYEIVEENGLQILYCSRLMESADGNPAVPGTRTVNVSIYVKGMSKGETIQPEFYAWMDGNQVYGENTRDDTAVYDNVVLNQNTTVCSNHASEKNGGKEMMYAKGDIITVSAALKMNIYLTPITTPTLTTYDFNVGKSSVINYGLGEVYGSAFTIGVSVQLYNDSAEKGLKGLEYPADDITFDLDISTLYNGLSLTGVDYNFTPLLYSYDGNSGTTKNSDGRTVIENINSIPYNKRGNTYYSCCNGGTWDASQSGSTISVTVSDYSIDGTFPITYPSSGDATKQTIASNIGTISTGRFSFIIPFYNVQMGGTNGDPNSYIGSLISSNGDFTVAISDNSLAAISVSDTALTKADDNSNQMKTDDDSRSQTARVDPSGTYSNVIMYAEKWGYNQTVPLTTDCSSTGYDWAYPGQEIGILAGVWSASYHGNENNYIVGYDDFIKIDADAIELVDEYKGSTDEDYKGMLFYSSAGYSGRSDTPESGSDDQADYYITHYSVETIQGVSHVSVLYAVLDTRENWASEDDMRSATQEDSNINFYDSLSSANRDGKIVGILVQVRGEISAIYPRFSMNAKIKDDAETEETYMITDTLRIWNKRSLTTLNKSLAEGASEITSIPVRTASGGGYDATVYCASGVPAVDLAPSYTKLTYNADGSTSGGTPSGMASGDTVLIVGYTTGVEINVLNGGDSKIYSLDDGQSIVDYSVKPTIELSEDETRTSTSVSATTTVTAEVTLPAGLTYINGSSYWGGNYTAPSVRGQQGTVTGGVALKEGSSVEYEFTYLDGFGETQNATITIKLEVTYNADGTTTLKWVFSNVPMMDSSYSNGGLTELLYFSASIESGSGNQWTLSTESVISGSGDQRVQTAANGNLATTEIIVTQASGSGIHETVAPLYNEIDSELTWVITHANNASTEEATLLLSVLPTSGYEGSYEFSGWSIDASKLTSSKLTLYYTTDDMTGKNAASYTVNEITAEGGNWTKVVDITGSEKVSLSEDQVSPMRNLTAWVLVGTLGAGDTIEATELIQTADNEGGNSYQNVASYRTSNGTALASYATAYIRSRTLGGLTWHDVNANGIQDEGESVTDTVTVTLMKLNESTNEYENIFSITTGQQIDVMRALATSVAGDYKGNCSTGKYLFYNMPKGTYAVKFTSASGGIDLSDYLASPVDNEDADDTLDSDGVPTYEGNSLSQTLISGIDMPEVTAISGNIYESENNDSGFFQYALQITKMNTETPSVLLKGAEFKLEKFDGGNIIDTSFNNNSGFMTGATDDSGLVTFGDLSKYKGLTAGTYQLTETKAPDGYNRLENAIKITIGTNGTINASASYTINTNESPLLKLVVSNTAGTILPETGGTGTVPFRLAGLLMMSVSAYLIYDTLKRRRISAS